MGPDPEKVEIFFVAQATPSPLLGLAHKAVSGYQNIKSSTIDEHAVLRAKQAKQPRTYYVLSIFEGAVFQHLRTQGCTILGPHVILHYLRENAALPAWPLPLFSAAMLKAVVTFTSIGTEKRAQLSEIVRMMHGEATGDFTSSVTVIVSPKIGSRKYYVGNQVGVPVVLPSWIEEAWRLSEIQDPFDATSKAFLSKFKVPIFHNLVISVSGLSAEDREEASRLIVANGGKYSGDLKVGECSHLVINKPVGEKYHYAKRWKVAIVTSQWLFDSLDRGYAQEEAGYKLTDPDGEKPQGSSTPEEQQAGRRKRSLPAPDLSVIALPNRTHVGESHVAADDSLTGQRANNASALLSKSGLDSAAPPPLSGCLVAALGRVARREEVASKLADLGARLCDPGVEALSEDVTHILVPEPDSLRPDHLRFEAGLPVVTLQWLLDCHEQRTRLPEVNYAVELPGGDPDETTKVEEEEKENQGGGDSTVAAAEEGGRIDAEEMAMINQYFEACDTDTDLGPPPEDTTAAVQVTLAEEPPPPPPSAAPRVVFSGARFAFHPSASLVISAAFSERLHRLLLENGAAQLDARPEAADYCVAHFFASDLPPPAAPGTKPRLVTLAWVYSCLENDRVLLEEACDQGLAPLVRPMRAEGSEDEQVLKSLLEGCVLCVSGFQGALRTCLCMFAEALGARMQGGLMRKAIPKKGIAASTHLVCSEPAGEKFEAAQRWKIPVVSKEWLFASAEQRVRPSVTEFAMGAIGEEPTFRTPTVPAPRPRPTLTTASAAESPRTAGLDTPGKFLKEGVRFLPKFDLTAMADMLKTPEACRRPNPETPLTEKVHKGLANALRLSKQQSPNSAAAPRGPLAEAVIYVARKLAARQIELNSLVQRLGGSYKWRYDPAQVTHVILEGPAVDAQQREELREARRDKKLVVHPAWVQACMEHGARLSEELFPPDLRPEMRLEMTASQEPSSLQRSSEEDSASRIDLKPPSESLPTELEPPEAMSYETTAELEESSPRCEILENLDQHLESSNSLVGKRRRRRRSSPLTESGAASSGGVEASSGAEEGAAGPGGSNASHSGDEAGSEDQIHPSQSLQVHWRYDDSDGHTLSAGHHLPSPLPSPRPSLASSPVRRAFLLSGFSEGDRTRLAALVERQGATVLGGRSASDLEQVTHLVVARPSRGEKFMTCAAAGRWVLHRSFLDATAGGAGWPSEERFEWGGPGTEPILAAQTDLERSLARAARRWRLAGGGAFSGWRVIFYARPSAATRLDSFARILRAGGAAVLAEKAPYPLPTEVTHAFVEARKGVPVEPAELPEGFRWLKHEFLSAFLTEEDEPRPEDFLLADRTGPATKRIKRGAREELEPAPSSERATRASKRLRRK